MYRYFKKYFYIFAQPFRTLYWFVLRPRTCGVICVVVNEGRVLLVKLKYGPKWWTPPGGNVNKGEDYVEAAKRECFEESGLCVSNVEFKYTYKNTSLYKRDTVGICTATYNGGELSIDENEVSEAKWFDIYNFPSNTYHRLNEVLHKLEIL